MEAVYHLATVDGSAGRRHRCFQNGRQLCSCLFSHKSEHFTYYSLEIKVRNIHQPPCIANQFCPQVYHDSSQYIKEGFHFPWLAMLQRFVGTPRSPDVMVGLRMVDTIHWELSQKCFHYALLARPANPKQFYSAVFREMNMCSFDDPDCWRRAGGVLLNWILETLRLN